MIRRALCLLLLSLALVSCGGNSDRVIVAAGTTVVDSGFIDALAARFESEHPDVELSILPNPTRLILELGRQQAADLLITHAPSREETFIAEGRSSRSEVVFESRFVLVGPPRLHDRFRTYEIPEVFRAIATEGLPFVSRGDGSGTHEAEMEAWLESGLDPTGQPWYAVTGSGMGPTLQVTDQREASTLAEIGSFIAAADSLGLVDLEAEPEGLENPYTATVVAGAEGEAGAIEFLVWLTSDAGQKAIAEINEELFGQIVYHPLEVG